LDGGVGVEVPGWARIRVFPAPRMRSAFVAQYGFGPHYLRKLREAS